MAETNLRFLSIVVPGRANVRAPLPPPTMRLVRENGRIAMVTLSEADLVSLIKQAAGALDQLRWRRDATVPTGSGG